ncbi:hypothetical protein PLICRDRAFT_163585 [Plicaturopsis crispa FD-325 SS-3]|nr:hypothetical protein PLICRDRAFT_163585 [Plicaturopsis crispa FD-325 SS-3]
MSSATHEDGGEKASKAMASEPPTPVPRSLLLRLLDQLPPWASAALQSPRAWKTLFRCWFGSWIAVVVLLPHKSLATLGNTAFFTLLASMFLPANLPFQMFFFLISTMILGVLLGWGIGSAAMRAALASRNQILLASTLQKAKQTAAGTTNPDAVFKLEIFQGDFLDTRSSIVFGCFLGLGMFGFALLRAYSPKLVFMSIFGTIALDIFCTFGPLFPFAEYTIINSLLISLSVYIAIALVTTTFIFPESMNHVCMRDTSALLEKLRTMLQLQDAVLSADLDGKGTLKPDGALMTKIKGLRAAVIGGQKLLMAKSVFINLEFSVGKWNGDDVRALEKPLLAIVSRCAGLQAFADLVGRDANIVTKEEGGAVDEKVSTEDGTATPSPAPSKISIALDTSLLRQVHARNSELEIAHSLRMQDLLPVIKAATQELREACIAGISAAQATVDLVNKARWRRNTDLEAEHAHTLDSATERLTQALAAFRERERTLLSAPFEDLIRGAKTRQEREALPLRSLYMAYVFAANLMSTAHVIVMFMEKVRETQGRRKKNRLWAPKELRAIAKLVTQREREDGALGDDVKPQAEAADVEHEEDYRRDPDSRPPSNTIQRVADTFHSLWKWSGTDEALFVFKYVAISIALFLPAVFPRSAQFYYEQKGVWALIMAQTTVNIYASDQIYNYVVRILGTVAGLCFGLVTWYVGNGSGYNVYGLAASAAVFLLPVLWLRLNLPAQHTPGVVLGCATFALVVGYSQVDRQLAVAFSPGVGWSVAWKRFTLVIIGCAASFIIMLIPPKSGRKAVRVRNAYAVTGLSNLYSKLLAHWIADRKHERMDEGKDGLAPAKWLTDFRLQLVTQADQLTYIRQLTASAVWEGNIRGKWPVEEYTSLVNTEIQLVVGLAQLGSALSQLSDDSRRKFLRHSKVLNPTFIGDVMSIFALVSQSLRTGEPMHQVLPTNLLDRLFYHNRALTDMPGLDGVMGFEELQSVEYIYYATGVVAVYHILQSLDELHRITRRLCGEVPLKGFERWREEYERAHAAA